ncbi:MAG TPA: hypothetical protein PLH72_01090 [Vicinamibacterales bacterium]|nr:hypothetical protein [Vicinamibacterales bacterium]
MNLLLGARGTGAGPWNRIAARRRGLTPDVFPRSGRRRDIKTFETLLRVDNRDRTLALVAAAGGVPRLTA